MSEQRGFSLLEMVVSFAIMGLALSLLLAIFSRNVNQVQIAEDYVHASQLAQSLMARVGHEWPVRASDLVGVEHDHYHWRVVMVPDFLALLPAGMRDGGVTPMRVTVTVSFGDGYAEPREVRLDTLRLAS